MADKIDMSLDDIIKKNKVRRGGAAGGRGRGGARGRGGIKRSGSAGRGGAGGARRPFRGASRGRSSRGGGGMRSPFSGGRTEGGSWKHDMYDGPKRGGIARESGPGKLVVSNLDFGVSDSDIHELFSEFGKLRTAAVHYDRSGRSLGTADVVFDRKSDAIKAMKQYNGVPLDGRPMQILLATSEVSPMMSPRPKGSQMVPRNKSFDGPRSSGGRVNKPFRGGAKRRGAPGGGTPRGGSAGRGRGGKRGGGRGGKREPAPSREDLDKELDSYLKAR